MLFVIVGDFFLMFLLRFLWCKIAAAMFAVVVAVLQGQLSGNAGVAEQGLCAIQNLAVSDDNSRLLGAAGCCEGMCAILFMSFCLRLLIKALFLQYASFLFLVQWL